MHKFIQRRAIAKDAAIVAVLFACAFVVCWLAMRDFRAAGARPYFYQSNFAPAVTMACGRGFGVPQPSPVALVEFLHEQRGAFDCHNLDGVAIVPLTAAAHANWYYLYGAAAGVWRVTGVSWLALDYLDAIFGGLTAVILYGLFRVVANRGVAVVLTALLTLSPANLTQLLSLRDYSKAPFVLATVLVLMVLVLRPMTRMATLAVAALAGAVVGVGYGFRGDLAIMIPFGAFVTLLFLPGPLRANLARNAFAMLALIGSFLLVSWPVLSGLDKGGCSFHVALLGLTSPLTNELALVPGPYRFGDALTDSFAILKVGDYATRVMHTAVPAYCDAQYDIASGQLYAHMVTTFPADFLLRAYGSVLSILRWGLEIPGMAQPAPPLSSSTVANIYPVLNRLTGIVAPLGPLVVVAAVTLTFAKSWRLGLAFATFVLFLAGYPAIQFEGRHWFHLRFIPWWAAVVLISQLRLRWTSGWQWRPLMPAALATAAVIVAMGLALFTLRWFQERSATQLFARYDTAVVTPLPITSGDTGAIQVRWDPPLTGLPHDRRGSDLLAITLDPLACDGAGPLALKITYEAGSPSLDLANDVSVPRPGPGAAPTKVFVPIFQSSSQTQVYQRFTGIVVAGAPAACVAAVGRVANGADWPLWLQVTMPPDWRQQPLHQSLRVPRVLRRVFTGEAD